MEQEQRNRLAAALRARKSRSGQRDSPYLAILKSQGTLPPFVCVHPSSGFIGYYHGLSERIPSDMPMWAMRPPGMKGEGFPDDYTGFARLYVDALLQADATGPFVLGGWSNGGLIAIEMGRILHESGHKVAFVALFDTITRHALAALAASDARLEYATRTVQYMARLRGVEIAPERARSAYERRWREAGGAAAAPEVAFRVLFATLHELGAMPVDLPPGYRVYKHLATLVRSYEPGPVDFPLALFRADESRSFRLAGECYGWERYAHLELSLHPVPGHHYTMLSPPFVDALGQAFSTLVDQRLRP